MFSEFKKTFYRLTRVPKTPGQLGAMIKDYRSEYVGPITVALNKRHISPEILLEFSVIGRNKEALQLALDYGARIDKLAPPFGIEIRRKRHKPLLHALYDNNIAFFEHIAEYAPEQFREEALVTLLKAITKDNVDPQTAIDVICILMTNDKIYLPSEDLYHLALLSQHDTVERFILALDTVDALLTESFLLDNIQTHLHRCSDYMAAHLLSKLGKDAPCEKQQSVLNEALTRSARAGKAYICELLIQHGADVNAYYRGNLRLYSAFSNALRYGHKKTADVFFRHNADFHYGTPTYYVLIDVIHGGPVMEEQILKILETATTPQHILSKALYFAANSNESFSDNIYIALLKKGADPLYSSPDFYDGASTLFASILRGHSNVFKLCFQHIKSTQDKEKLINYGLTHLLKAYTDARFKAKEGAEQDIAALIREHRHVFNQTQINEALIMVAERGRNIACELFLSIGADPNYIYSYNTSSVFNAGNKPSTALIQSIKEEQYSTAELLVKHEARVSPELFDVLEQLAEQDNIYGLRFLMRAGGIIPRTLSDQDALKMTACETWTEVLDELNEDKAYLLPYILPRYFNHLNITPMEYLSRCPEWHKYYVLSSINDF